MRWFIVMCLAAALMWLRVPQSQAQERAAPPGDWLVATTNAYGNLVGIERACEAHLGPRAARIRAMHTEEFQREVVSMGYPRSIFDAELRDAVSDLFDDVASSMAQAIADDLAPQSVADQQRYCAVGAREARRRVDAIWRQLDGLDGGTIPLDR